MSLAAPQHLYDQFANGVEHIEMLTHDGEPWVCTRFWDESLGGRTPWDARKIISPATEQPV